jgi:hypothetical protein
METIHNSSNPTDSYELIVSSRRQKIIRDRLHSTKRNDSKIKINSETLKQAKQKQNQKNKELKKKENAEIQFKLETKRRDILKRRDRYLLRKMVEFRRHRNNALRRIRKRKVRELEEANMESKERIKAALDSKRAKITEQIEKDKIRLNLK